MEPCELRGHIFRFQASDVVVTDGATGDGWVRGAAESSGLAILEKFAAVVPKYVIVSHPPKLGLCGGPPPCIQSCRHSAVSFERGSRSETARWDFGHVEGPTYYGCFASRRDLLTILLLAPPKSRGPFLGSAACTTGKIGCERKMHH